MKPRNNTAITFLLLLPICAIIVAILTTKFIVQPILSNNKSSGSNNAQSNNIQDQSINTNVSKQDSIANSTNSAETKRLEVIFDFDNLHLIQFGVFEARNNALQHQKELSDISSETYIFLDNNKFRVVSGLFFDDSLSEVIKNSLRTTGHDFFISANASIKKYPINVYENSEAALQPHIDSISSCIKAYSNALTQYKFNIISKESFISKHRSIQQQFDESFNSLSTITKADEESVIQVIQQFIEVFKAEPASYNIGHIYVQYMKAFEGLWNYQ